MCVFVLMHMYITEPRPSTSQLQQARSVHHASQSITKELYCTLHGHTFRPRPGFVDHGPRRPRPERLRPHRPPDHVAIMIAAKNGATTTATTVTSVEKLEDRTISSPTTRQAISRTSQHADYTHRSSIKAKYYF